jgi:hypothetical protein
MEQIQKLTKVQAGLLRSIKARHDAALNAEMMQALMDIIAEQGLAEDVEAGKVGVRVTPDLGSIVVVRLDDPKEVEHQ